MKENKFQVICYSEDDMRCYNVINATVTVENPEWDEPCSLDRQRISGLAETTIDFETSRVPIELDPTTMKRIAKYNKEVELESLNRKIEKKNEELKKLECEKQNLEKKLDNMKNFIKDFFETDNLDPYIFANYKDYDADDDDDNFDCNDDWDDCGW